jgi:hypothetical protein
MGKVISVYYTQHLENKYTKNAAVKRKIFALARN